MICGTDSAEHPPFLHSMPLHLLHLDPTECKSSDEIKGQIYRALAAAGFNPDNAAVSHAISD